MNNNKNILRKEIKILRENLSETLKKENSQKIIKKLLELDEIKNSKAIMSYIDFKNEVETRELNEILKSQGKIVLLPKILNDEIIVFYDEENYELGKFGVEEPRGKIYSSNIDLVIVPGIVFNELGDRIGFGKGYYDKFLAKNKNSKRVSMAYDFQINNNFSGENFDEKIEVIVTEKRLIKL